MQETTEPNWVENLKKGDTFIRVWRSTRPQEVTVISKGPVWVTYQVYGRKEKARIVPSPEGARLSDDGGGWTSFYASLEAKVAHDRRSVAQSALGASIVNLRELLGYGKMSRCTDEDINSLRTAIEAFIAKAKGTNANSPTPG